MAGGRWRDGAAKTGDLGANVVAGLPVIRRQDDVLEPVYKADPEGRPVVHHRTVDTLGIMLRAGTITKDMHDAARDFQAQFTIARFDSSAACRWCDCRAAVGAGDLTDAQVDARRRVGRSARCARRPGQPGRLVRLACRRLAALGPRVGDAAGLGRQAGAGRAGAGDPGGGAGGAGFVVRI